MIEAPVPDSEPNRIRALKALEVLDSSAEPQFDALVHAASQVAETPVSLISLVDTKRQWFKASVGLDGVTETGRDIAFCSHAILGDGPFEVENAAADPRFHDNPLVANDPHVRFYCGVPITLRGGERVGTLCVIDEVPRKLDDRQVEVLKSLAVAAATALEGRKAARDLRRESMALARKEEALVEVNAELKRANEELRSFVRVASHDLKSPMLTISRLAEWTIEDLGAQVSDAAAENLRLIQTRVARLETLIRDLREYAMLGMEETPTRPMNVRELLQGSFDMQDGSSRVDLTLDYNVEQFTTTGAPLEVVLRNLLGNAIKHGTAAQPKIRASAKATGDLVKFSISDNGPGIDPQFHSVVFEMLRSLGPRDRVEGSGMGLALAKKAVEQAGGTISLESDGTQGTTLSFTWPGTDLLPRTLSPTGGCE